MSNKQGSEDKQKQIATVKKANPQAVLLVRLLVGISFVVGLVLIMAA